MLVLDFSTALEPRRNAGFHLLQDEEKSSLTQVGCEHFVNIHIRLGWISQPPDYSDV